MGMFTASATPLSTAACSQRCKLAAPQSCSSRQIAQRAAATLRHSSIGGQQLLWRPASAGSSRSARFSCRADASDDERLPEGARVRVKQSITIWHAPKRKEGLDLKGLEGEVVAYVDEYKGQKLSSNLPVKVKFLLQNDGKEIKFFSHLAPEEIQTV